MQHRRRQPMLAARRRAGRMCAGTVLVLVPALALGATSCSGARAPTPRKPVRWAAQTRAPAPAASVLAGSSASVAAGVAQSLFSSAPVVIVTDACRAADLAAAAADAARAHAPLLLAAGAPGGSAQTATTATVTTTQAAGQSCTAADPAIGALRAQIRPLDPRVVLAVGVTGSQLAAQLPGLRVVTKPAQLPATGAPAPLRHVALLVRQGDASAGTLAAAATARVAGARVIGVSGYDPQADPGAITALSAAQPRQVLALGGGFGPAAQLAWRIAVAETGRQLPGGGQILFPMHRLVALYGCPGTPSLGALGQQGLRASITRARMVAAPYRSLSTVPVIPAFEIIATVAEAHAGPNGDYSYQAPVAALRPWVRRATAAGLYVILDLQAGRASLLAQAKLYQSLLRLPDVGLAVDPEWKLQPGQLPLRQIGSVRIREVNSVIRWLAGLIAQYRLPQKLLVLHQFRLSMIINEQRLDTRYGDIAIVVHMDGQGSPGDKERTWQAVTGAAPAGVFFGWKNFYVKDHPMLTPQQTMARTPQPVMISYQ